MKIFQQLYLDPITIKDQDIIFDLDGTLIEGDIGETLYYHTLLAESMPQTTGRNWLDPIHQDEINSAVFLSKEEADLLMDYREKLAAGSYVEAYLNTAERLERYKREDLEYLAQAILADESLPAKITCQRSIENGVDYFDIPYGVRIKPDMLKLVDFFYQHGANLWIVSASPQMVCEFVAKKFEIGLDRVLGTLVSENGEEIPRFPWGPKKLDVLKESGVVHPLLVFGDGEGDVEMLAFAKYPVVVEGNSRKVVKLAIENNWWVYTREENNIE